MYSNYQPYLPTGSHALRCMCDLLVAHPQFNFAPNMVNLLVPYLNSRNDGDRATAKSAVQGGNSKHKHNLIHF